MKKSKIKKISRNKIIIIMIAVALFAGMTALLFNSEKNNREIVHIPSISENEEITDEDRIAIQIMKSQLEKNNVFDFILSISNQNDQKETKVLTLIYKSESKNEQKFKEEMALISGTFIGIKQYKGWEINEFAAIVKNEDGNVEGTWHISEEWISDYISGNMVDGEFVSKVINTYEVI